MYIVMYAACRSDGVLFVRYMHTGCGLGGIWYGGWHGILRVWCMYATCRSHGMLHGALHGALHGVLHGALHVSVKVGCLERLHVCRLYVTCMRKHVAHVPQVCFIFR